jgi:hypothetical protein
MSDQAAMFELDEADRAAAEKPLSHVIQHSQKRGSRELWQ